MIDIHQRVRGAKHCGLEHEPDRHQTCDKCDQPLQHKTVFNICINGSEVAGLDLKTEQQANDLAVKFVDHLLETGAEDINEDELIDEDPDNEEEEDGRDDEKDVDNKNPDADPPIDHQSPPDQTSPPAENRNQTDMSGIIKQMDKLKWFERAAAIVKGRKKRPPKKK
ncbi:hypothetical protein KKC47_00925 [Patescibacteria group bacterium]|nr:hypothetical protein [Patescibacteria group bacterium]